MNRDVMRRLQDCKSSGSLGANSSPLGKSTLVESVARKSSAEDNGVQEHAGAAIDRAAKSAGAPLPDSLKQQFESSLGADLSSVRVHTGAASVEAADAVSARAYTVGQDVHFNAGEFDPQSSAGQHLLAHEVAHTVQQSEGAGTPQFKLEVSTPGDAHEVEADRAADAMVTGTRADVSSMTGVQRQIQRDKQPEKKSAEETQRAAQMEQRGQDEEKLANMGLGGDWAAQNANKDDDSAGMQTISVAADRAAADALIADIKAAGTSGSMKTLSTASRREQYQNCLTTNTATLFQVQLWASSLDVTQKDTSAFASTYFTLKSDYAKLEGMAREFSGGADGDPVVAAMGSFKADDRQVQTDPNYAASLLAYQTARNQLATGEQNITATQASVLSAGSALQSAAYGAQAAAAGAQSESAKTHIASINAGVQAVAGWISTGAGLAQKAITGLMGMPGGVTPDAAGWNNVFAVADGGKADFATAGQKAAGKGIGMAKEALSGDVSGLVASLVTEIGALASAGSINQLQSAIAAGQKEQELAGAQVQAIAAKALADAYTLALKNMVVAIQNFAAQKAAVTAASDLLSQTMMANDKLDPKLGFGVKILGAADNFVAQADMALATGEQEQSSAGGALKLQNAISTGAGGTQLVYYRGKGNGVETVYVNLPVDRQDQADMFGGRDEVGAANLDGPGGAKSTIAAKMKTITELKNKVVQLRGGIEGFIGIGPTTLTVAAKF